MNDNTDKHSFRTTLPGIISGIAAFIAAITGLLVATGFLEADDNPAPITNIRS